METYNEVSPAALEPRRGPVKHSEVFDMADDTANPLNVPYGYCHCGCGQKTKIATYSWERLGWVRGEPKRFCLGHRPMMKPRYIVNEETGCWEWQRSINRGGYGTVHDGGKTLLAHRYYYEQSRGPIAKDLQIDHLCRNTRCVNPDHLEVVTAAINTQRRSGVKLNMDLAREIRSLPSKLSSRQVAEWYGVSETTIHEIRHGRAWIEPPEGDER